MNLKIYIIWALAVFLLGDSIYRSTCSNFNFGLFIIYMITAAMWIYALFHRQIDAFCDHGVGRVLKILFFCGCAVYGVLLGFVAVSGFSDRPQGDEKAIVVLGAGLHGERISSLLKCRLDTAYDTWQTNPEAMVVVTGGQGPGEDIPEATAMRRYLLEKGIPEEKLIEENRSTSTEENFLFAKKLLAEAGIPADAPIVFVTNAFHCYRAGKYAALVGFADVDAQPAGIPPTAIAPCYLREVFAVLYYWVFKSAHSGWIVPFIGVF